MKAIMKFAAMLIVIMMLVSSSVSVAGQTAPIEDSPLTVRVYFKGLSAGQMLFLAFEPLILETNYEEGYHIMKVKPSEIDQLRDLGLKIEKDDAWRPPPVLKSLPEGIDSIPGYSCYRTVEETFASAQKLATDHPNLAEWLDVGDSWVKTVHPTAGYDMKVLKITNSAVTGDKPKLFITASIHAREYTPAEMATRFGEYLVSNYNLDADATWLLDHHEVHLMLQANPDGRKKAETGLSWRKNTNENYCGATSNSRGADLNRNFSFYWNSCAGCSSGNPCDATYRGPSSASEPETQAVIAYLRGNFPDQRGPNLTDAAPSTATGIYLDMHSYSQLVLWPWGMTSSAPPNNTALRTLGRKFAYFNSYTPQQSYQLYGTDGDTTDFAYGELGIAAYTFEMGTTFFQDCASFENTIYPTNLQALIYAAKVVRTPYLTPLGPDALGLALSDSSVPVGNPVTLSAIINDTRYRSGTGEPTQNIAAAEYYIDVPPWQNGAVAHSMTVSDGSFDSKIEEVTAMIDTSGLTSGQHIVFVRGKDTNDNWGAFSAIFINMTPNAVELRSFSALEEGNAILLKWETTSEINNLGFNLYRAETPDGQQIKLNAELIPGKPGFNIGQDYVYLDNSAVEGITYYYWLEDVDLYSMTSKHGPVSAKIASNVQNPWTILFMPVVIKYP